MTKAPRAGAVKTRLQPPLTAEEAASLNIGFLQDTAAAIIEVGASAQGVGVYTPVGAEAAYENIFPDRFLLTPQRGEDFGERLIHATEDLQRAGFSSFCLIDSDSPTVTKAAFAQAAKALAMEGDRVVLGPSDDGGYYLIGLKNLHPELFHRIDWSTDQVLPQTLERADEISLEVELLPNFYDIDDRATLRRLCDDLLGRETAHAPATKEFLENLIAREGRERIWPQ